MTEATINVQKKESIRNYIAHLLEQLAVDYKNTKSERKQIAEILPDNESEFTVLEEIELLTVNIRGYASQIQAQGWVEKAQSVIEQLQNMQFFSIPTIAKFYWITSGEYPQLKAYIRTLDYLRLLIIEYLDATANSLKSV